MEFFFGKNTFFRTHIGVKQVVANYNLELMIINEPFPKSVTLAGPDERILNLAKND